MRESQFLNLFTANKPVIFYFHGSQRALHAILHSRPRADRFHVRSFNEQGTATTPFQIVVLNEISRYPPRDSCTPARNRFDIPTTLLIERCRSSSESATAYKLTGDATSLAMSVGSARKNVGECLGYCDLNSKPTMDKKMKRQTESAKKLAANLLASEPDMGATSHFEIE